eukprot:1158201-Pelagomonas_calceolata.AAC.6
MHHLQMNQKRHSRHNCERCLWFRSGIEACQRIKSHMSAALDTDWRRRERALRQRHCDNC